MVLRTQRWPSRSRQDEQTRVLVIALGRNSPNKYCGYRQLEAGAKPPGNYQQALFMGRLAELALMGNA
ncbi:hypothetical protein OUZ56_010589 [Daphnia magna]|uniref:Uncharacterized protein n=1 Tax=Daphnia magna TaxID=35525 RepID=A0ABR0AIZ7_9CRUS|nr:hypothetical protein OUZ56_010589 [Daphnia magna]